LCLLCSIFDAAGSVFGCRCRYTQTPTHTAAGELDVSPGVGTGHLEGPTNPDGPNLGIFVTSIRISVQSKQVYIYGGMRSELMFLLFNTFFSVPKEESKR